MIGCIAREMAVQASDRNRGTSQARYGSAEGSTPLSVSEWQDPKIDPRFYLYDNFGPSSVYLQRGDGLWVLRRML